MRLPPMRRPVRTDSIVRSSNATHPRPRNCTVGWREESGPCGRVQEHTRNFNPYEHESLHAKHKLLASQRVIDTINLSGPVEDIDEKIYDLQELGLNGVSCVQYAIIDQKSNMREISNSIMPQFR